MANQGRRGARAENAVADELRAAGYDLVRSAGSKGAGDLWAVHDNEIMFVQCKLGKDDWRFVMPAPAERRELLRIALRVGGFPVAATRFPGSGPRPARTEYRILLGTGPKDFDEWTLKGAGE